MKNIRFPFEQVPIKRLEDNITSNGKLTAVIDVCGFFLCKRGWAKVLLDEKTYVIKAGDIYLYTPSTFLSLVERSDDLEGTVVKSSLDMVIPFLDNNVSSTSLIRLRENPCVTLTAEQIHYIEQIGAIIDERQKRYEIISEDSPALPLLYKQVINLAEAVLNEIFFAYFSSQSIEPEPQTNNDRVFQNFMTSLMKNYKREREVGFYAREQFLTPRYFSTVVRECSGHSASQWIVEMVITNAKKMLTSSDKSIKQIALDFNFPTQSFFGKYFKQYTGASPKEYRAKHRGR